MRVQVAKSLQFPGKFVLVDQKTMKRVDYPEIDSSSEALQEALQYNKEMAQLESDEASEGIIGCDDAGDLELDSRF